MAQRIGSEDWRRLEELFGEAIGLPPEDRVALLESRCGEDLGLRRQVERLVAADGAAGGFLARPALEDQAPPIRHEGAEPAERKSIGPYRLIRKIGEGGMSDVWLAVRADGELRRRVAIKCLRRNMATAELRRRSRREQQILASLDHPNIARLYEVGSSGDGLPYFIMEYVEGEPIVDYAVRHSLPVADRLELFRTVCSAVHHAHQNLIVHRDIKPSNVLVTAAGVPKLLDFGIAKWMNPELTSRQLTPTLPRDLFLTPAYASPEQLAGKAVTTASDVYSLGVVLRELLTGEHPGRRADRRRPLEGARRPPPRRLAGDLETVVAKALRREPYRRYASAHQLAEDLRRFSEGQPVIARKPTFRYRAGRFLHRHRAAAALMSTLVAALLIAAFGLGALAIRLQHQGELIRRERDHARLYADVLKDILETSDPFEGHGSGLTAHQILREGAETVLRLPSHHAEVKADLLDTIGNLYRRLGSNAEAEPLLRAALRLRTDAAGPNSPAVAASLASLGVLHVETGDYEAAEACHRRALEIRRAHFGEHHEDTAVSLLQLALSVELRGRFAEAEELCHRAVAMARGLPGDHQDVVAVSLDRLGDVLFKQDRLDEAEALHREALAIYRQIHGSKHLAVGDALNNLSIVLQKKGEYGEAERLIREALEISRRTLGDEHRTTLTNLTNLANLAAFRNEYEEAERLYAQALETGRRHLGDGHPTLPYMLLGLGSARTRLGRPQEGEEPLRQALAIWQREYPPGHFLIARLQLSLGECLLRQARYAEAEEMLVASHGVMARERPPRELETKRALAYLVDLYTAWGRPEAAAKYRGLLPEKAPP